MMRARVVIGFGVPVLVAGALLLARESGADKPEAPGFKMADLAWIAGSWGGEHDGGWIEEHWMAPNGGSMSGMSRLVIGDRTAFHEYLRIAQNKDGTIDYLAQPKGKHPPTLFRLTTLTATKAVFENPEHDDPKVIRYELKDGALVATTEGDSNGKHNVHEFAMKPSSLKK